MALKDINKATREDIAAIPQMSSARAESIVHWRENHGDYTDMGQLSKVPGISETMAAQMAEYFTIGDDEEPEASEEDKSPTRRRRNNG